MSEGAAADAFTPAAWEALKAFPIEPDALELVSLAENVTYRVVDLRDGVAYALRLHRPWYHTIDELISERAWVRALDDADIAVQAPVRTRDGQEYASVTVPGSGEKRFAGLARWTTGRVLAEVLRETTDTKVAEQHFAQLGALTASLHDQAATWLPPAAFTRHQLDADGFMGDTPHWGPFWDHQGLTATERRLMLDTRARLHAALARLDQASSTYSMIHADMHPGNVLVNGGKLTVIDFDDAAWGWHAYDIAVALVHQQGPELAAFERAYIAGYRSVRTISDQVLALLPMFRLVRGLAQIGWYHQRPELKRSASRFDEVKAVVLEQCLSIGKAL